MFDHHGEKGRKPTLPVLCLYDAQMRELYRDRLDAFPFPEAVILSASNEFFGDPQPCEIHRRAVQVRLSGEIQLALPADQLLAADDLPPLVLLYYQEYHPAYVKLETK